jgi:hypothetical protein
LFCWQHTFPSNKNKPTVLYSNFQKIALDQRDEKIFKAMLWNLESFLKDAHQKSRSHIPVKNRKIIFWALGDVQKVVGELIKVY